MSKDHLVNVDSGKFITLERAKRKQERYLLQRREIFKEEDPVRSQFFGKEKLLELLSKDNCVGLKIVYGLDRDKSPSLILSSADAYLNIITKDNTCLKDGDDDDYLALGPQCPRVCQH